MLQVGLAAPEMSMIDDYAGRLRGQLERRCPDYAPRVSTSREGITVEVTIGGGSEQAATQKALHWLKRSIQADRTLQWNRAAVEVACSSS